MLNWQPNPRDIAAAQPMWQAHKTLMDQLHTHYAAHPFPSIHEVVEYHRIQNLILAYRQLDHLLYPFRDSPIMQPLIRSVENLKNFDIKTGNLPKDWSLRYVEP